VKNNNYTYIFYKIGQVTGISAGAITAILWMMALWMPDTPFTFSTASMAVTLIMMILAVVAIVASMKGHPAILLVIFGVSFFPVGLYVLGVPHWIQWVGLSNMGYLLAAIIIWRFRPLDKDQSAQSG
jgi:hypothetical protein